MNTLLHDEKFIRETLSSDDFTYHFTWSLFLLHFTAIDYVEHTSHRKAINYLFQLKNQKYTKQSIAKKIFSNVKTFKTDREHYAAYFYYFYDFIQNGNFTAESALSSLF